MRWDRIVAGTGVGFAAFLVQLFATFGGAALAFLAAIAIGVYAAFLFRRLEMQGPGPWLPVLIAFCASTGGILLPASAIDTPGAAALWIAPAGAVVAAAFTVALIKPRSRNWKCSLCKQHDSGDPALCPRCRSVVCLRSTCWNALRLRCQRCYENKVPLLTPDRAWWQRVFGERALRGRCQHCHVTTERTDLFACQNCGRLRCKQCWDFENGQCDYCRWTVPDLPVSLRNLLELAE